MANEWILRTIDAPASDMLFADEVAKMFGISRATFDNLVKSGEFPKGLSVGSQTKVWDWRAVAFYRLKLEMAGRVDPKPSQNAPDPS